MGAKVADDQLGLSLKQVQLALDAGRKGNIRDKMLRCANGEAQQ